jgi:AcrR family transcriptional regulator
MGLRELKAARTRGQIVDVALSLFIDQGYDETTMEQIAERAEVGSTTLYRYFPSKDALVLEPFRRSMELGPRLRERPAAEPLNVALGAAILEALGAVVDDGTWAALRRIVDNAPVPRARLIDLGAQAQRELETAIAERMGRPGGDLLVIMTARITFTVFQVAAETARPGDPRQSPSAIAREMLRTLGTLELVIPAPPSPRPHMTARKP